MTERSTYERLTEHFAPEEHKTLQARGGQTYVPWNLVAGRLNDVLGVTGWKFEVMREGFTQNECWVLGRLTAIIDGEETFRDQYGCADIMLGSSPNTDLLKKAGTDALKKCAQVLGVALYLTDAEERAEIKAAQQGQKRAGAAPKAPAPAPPAPQTCDAAFYTRKWHATVKGTRFEQDEVRKRFLIWYSDNAFDSLAAWLKDATQDEAETLIATLKDRIEQEQQKPVRSA